MWGFSFGDIAGDCDGDACRVHVEHGSWSVHFSGLKTQDYGLLVAGSVLVIALALLVDAVFVWVHRLSARHMAGSVERRS